MRSLIYLLAFACFTFIGESKADFYCTDSEFACEDGSECLELNQFCDGIQDCADDSDEPLRVLPLGSSEARIPCRRSYLICLLPKSLEEKRDILCSKDPNCADSEFACENGSGCLRFHNFCDGYKSCADGSDETPRLLPLNSSETRIPCRRGIHVCLLPKSQEEKKDVLCTEDPNCTDSEFACVDGRGCVPSHLFCNGEQHCADESDEWLLLGQELNREIICDVNDARLIKTYSWKCVLPKKYQCDGQEVCQIGGLAVDECLCGDKTNFLDDKCFRCLSEQYKVIPITKVCDSIFDCKDLSDECLCLNMKSRPALCNMASFGGINDVTFSCDAIDISEVIGEEKICDQKIDCRDQLDEKNCDQDREAITATYCDGIPESVDYVYDEECNCPVNPKFCEHLEEYLFFSCPNDISNSGDNLLCNGEKDCQDGEDELYCSNRTHFYCDDESQLYLLRSQQCDRVINCDDESDELNCQENFRCFNEGVMGAEPVYIHVEKLCDGTPDCAGGTDECLDKCISSAFSSASMLIRSKAVLGLLFSISLLALGGNLTVFLTTIYQLLWPKKKKRNRPRYERDDRGIKRTNSILILNLTIADSLVAIYTMAICAKSVSTEGSYCRVDQDWRSGTECSAIGALLVIGSEESIFTMITIIGFRLFSILRPVAFIPFKMILLALGVSWFASISLAVIPLLSHLEDIFTTSIWYANSKPFSTIEQKDVTNLTHWLLLMHKNTNETHGKVGSWSTLEKLIVDMNHNLTARRRFGFYSSHTVCIPDLFPDPVNNASWWYSLLLLIVNFLGFIAILSGYARMYRKVTKKSIARTPEMESTLSSKMQKRVGIIIGTDFFCWMPVCIMGFLQLGGVNISNDWRLVVGMIVIPINSALNPMIYSGIHSFVWKWIKRAGSFFQSTIRRIRGTDDNENRVQEGDVALRQSSGATEQTGRTTINSVTRV